MFTAWLEQASPQISAWLEAEYPNEGCGLIVRSDDGFSWQPCQNMADLRYASKPCVYPRSARTYYVIDPSEILAALAKGLVAIVHSHPDARDDFSDQDLADATFPRAHGEPLEPMFPDMRHVVVSIHQGRAQALSVFRFNADQVTYVRELRIPEISR